MQKENAILIKKIYKPFVAIVFFVVFFAFYNSYLIDRSLVNLKIALNRATEAKTIEDLQRIKRFLQIPILKEISKKSISKEVLLSLEATDNIATTAKSENQIEDIKFYLKTAIKALEKERGGILSVLDNLNSKFIAPELKLSKNTLQSKVENIIDKIKATNDKEELISLYYELGNTYAQLANLPKAEEAFLETVKIDPQSPLAIKARFNLAWVYKTAGEYEKAKNYFEQLSKEFPEEELVIASKYEVADTLYKKGDYALARDKYAQLANEYPQIGTADFALSQAGYISLYNLGDKETAEKFMSELEEKYSQTDVTKHTRSAIAGSIATDYREEGFRLVKEKAYVQAIENFEKAIVIAPKDSLAVSGMGLGLYWLGKQDEALDEAEKAVHLSVMPDELTLVNSLFVYINTGKLDEAIRIGEEALGKTTVPRAEFYYNLGYAYVLKSKIDKAISQFERSIRVNPDFVFAYNNLGCVLWMKGLFEDAARRLREAIDRVPEYADAHFNLGVIYFHLNRLEDGYKEFKKVLDIDPANAQAKSYITLIVDILKYNP